MVGTVRLLPLFALLAAVGTAAPEGPPVYKFTGKPLHMQPTCTLEQVQSLGLPCSEADPCPTFLELSDIEQVGARLFLTGNVHTDATTIESVLLSTEDDGKTCPEPTLRIPMAGLDRIQFIDFEAGWISGQIQQTQPRDPFFLITHDGGKNWRRQNVFGETKPGAVERFRFDSRTNGSMLIDRVQPDDNGMRHILYDTSTGGESWSIREISPKPIPWKQPDPGDPDVRIRTDAPTKSYRIERRQGGKWEMLSSFLVSAGPCKPAEPIVTEATTEAAPPEAPPKPAVDPPIAPRRRPTLKK
jgi:hypothetical protein